jgi:uncharacterized RDD family membrane protein YckC
MSEELEQTAETTTAPTGTISLEYPKASWWKRLFAFLFDFLMAAIVATCIIVPSKSALNSNAQYANAVSTMNEIELSSGLYVTKDKKIVPITTAWSFDSSATPTNEDYARLNSDYEAALQSFFTNSAFFVSDVGKNKYLSLKVGDSSIKQSDKKTPYWHYVVDTEGNNQLVAQTDDKTLLNFYVTAIDDNAIPLISTQTPSYIEASKVVFWGTFLLIYLVSLLCLFVFFCLVPLIFKRGWQTFGKKLFKISLINGQAVNPKARQYWLHCLLQFFFDFVIGSVSFGIPLIVSFTMLMTRKDGQDFEDYVSGLYAVDTTDDTIYFSRDEYEERNRHLDSMQLKDTTNLSEKSVNKPL